MKFKNIDYVIKPIAVNNNNDPCYGCCFSLFANFCSLENNDIKCELSIRSVYTKSIKSLLKNL